MHTTPPRRWTGEGRIGARRTIVTIDLPEDASGDVDCSGSVPRIDGILRPDIPVRPAFGRAQDTYQRPMTTIDNTTE